MTSRKNRLEDRTKKCHCIRVKCIETEKNYILYSAPIQFCSIYINCKIILRFELKEQKIEIQ